MILIRKIAGQLNYAKSFGTRSMGENANPLDLNTPLFLASMTKLLTSIACMQLIERGLISLDTDVSSFIPDLAAQPILHGFDDNDKPILSDRKNPILFVHLLTHSAGTAYDKMVPVLEKYRDQQGQPEDRATMSTKCVYPLLFEPGTYWSYGTGSAGKLSVNVQPRSDFVELASSNGISHQVQPEYWERFEDAFATEAIEFCESVLEDKDVPVALDIGIQSLEIGLALQDALLSGQVQRFDEKGHQIKA